MRKSKSKKSSNHVEIFLRKQRKAYCLFWVL